MWRGNAEDSSKLEKGTEQLLPPALRWDQPGQHPDRQLPAATGQQMHCCLIHPVGSTLVWQLAASSMVHSFQRKALFMSMFMGCWQVQEAPS